MKILIIEDDRVLAEAIAFGLNKDGAETALESDGARAVDHPLAATADLIVLDLGLPTLSGLEVCQRWRTKGITTPIIVLTARDQVDDKVAALNGGADDYLTKPFSLEELRARLHALTRRTRDLLPTQLTAGPLVLDTEKRTLEVDGQLVPLTLKEFAIVEYLMRHPQTVLTREQILDHVWNYDFDSFSNIVDVHLNNIRKKISAATTKPVLLETVRGVGYRINTDQS